MREQGESWEAGQGTVASRQSRMFTKSANTHRIAQDFSRERTVIFSHKAAATGGKEILKILSGDGLSIQITL